MKTFKSTLLLLALGATTILSSCKKDDKEVDPRDAYVGTFDLEGEGDCDGEEYTMKIEKDAKSSTGLVLQFDLFEEMGEDKVSAELKGGTLEADDFTYTGETDEGEQFSVKIGGEGKISGKTLSFTVMVQGKDACDFEGDKK